MTVKHLNPWDIIARRPRCPKCSSHKADTVVGGWLSICYQCKDCGERWIDDQRTDINQPVTK